MQEPYHRAEHLYLLPIGGTAMASLAGLLQAAGHRVEGVDTTLYPPMSTLLEELEIPVRLGWDPPAIPREVDRVIIGNAVGRDNPEVREVLARRVPFLAQAEAVAHYLLGVGREAMVVAGTHGKTTTTSLLAWILEATGTDPSYLVGGMLRWSGRSFRLGGGPWMVLEGDEYNTAFFDRGPKFLHYRPRILVLGPVEYDHADIYPSLDAVLTAFRAGSAQVPPHGRIIVSGWSELAREAVRDATAPVRVVGPEPGSAVEVRNVATGSTGIRARLVMGERQLELRVPLWGEHNLANAALAVAAAAEAGVEPERAVEALSRFPGVKRRMEVVGEAGGVTVVDDFAHHPTALEATIGAARQRWPGRRLVVAFEPRSLTAGRRLFQEAYPGALGGADVVLVAPVYHRDRLGPEDTLDRDHLAAELERRGVEAVMPPPGSDPAAMLADRLRPGDVVVACSSGDFGGLHGRLLELLAAWEPGRSPV